MFLYYKSHITMLSLIENYFLSDRKDVYLKKMLKCFENNHGKIHWKGFLNSKLVLERSQKHGWLGFTYYLGVVTYVVDTTAVLHTAGGRGGKIIKWPAYLFKCCPVTWTMYISVSFIKMPKASLQYHIWKKK